MLLKKKKKKALKISFIVLWPMLVHYKITEFGEALIGKFFWRVDGSENLRDVWTVFLILHTNIDIVQCWIHLLHVQ